MEIYETAKFHHSSNNLSGDIVLKERYPEQKRRKKILKEKRAKTKDLHLHADLIDNQVSYRPVSDKCTNNPKMTLNNTKSKLPHMYIYMLQLL